MLISPRHRDLVSLFPQFLSVRRRGWKGLQAILQLNQLERPAFFLLMALVQETDPGQPLSQEEMASQLFNPYSTFYPILASLPLLVEKGYLLRTDAHYLVTPQGRSFIEQVEQSARHYLATLTPLPLPELTRLATVLEEIAALMWQADEPAIKAHQMRCHRLPPLSTHAPMAQLEAAIFALWTARDDAHIAAWRTEELSGPQMDLLNHLSVTETHTLAELAAILQQTQRPADVEQGITAFGKRGYVSTSGEHITLTEPGRHLRNNIEQETDRIYFTPWPPLSTDELDWLYSALQNVCDTLG
ncbi:MAG TPA: hypothetical protein VKR06_06175 [Ktedonosporobacter sp.]|nr:hypothetical protein [Ktedonosporobacter sp.]